MNSPEIIESTEPCKIRNGYGEFELIVFRILAEGKVEEVIAIYVKPNPIDCLLRINSACLTSESFGDVTCDCKWQLDVAFKAISQAQSGLIIYAPSQEGRGVGIFNKIKSLHLMHTQNCSTVAAFRKLGFMPDHRSYAFIDPVLSYFGIRSVRLMTNNPDKISAFGVNSARISETVPIVNLAEKNLSGYLNSKKEELGHLIDIAPIIRSQ